MFADIIRKERKNKGLSQRELGEILGVTQQAVGRWEKKLAFPDTATLPKLAKYFGVTTDYLLSNDEKSSVMKNQSKKPKDLMKLLDQEQSLTMNGEVLGEEDMEIIKSAIEQGYHLAKKLNKRKKSD
jgi:transcriptional regulator with XRE-family HTH domain